MNEQFSIAGKVAVITGAGGVLGGSIAKCFMQQGAKVVAVDIRQEQLDKRVEELKTYGEDVIGIVGNVLDIASLEKLADDIVAKWGRIDILLNIAGGNMPGAIGIPEDMLREAAKMAVCKINIDSDLRLAMTGTIRKYFNEHPEHFDPRQYLGPARTAIKEMVAHKIKNVLGCDGQA